MELLALLSTPGNPAVVTVVIRLLLNMTIVLVGVLSFVFCNLAVCALASAVRAVLWQLLGSFQLSFTCQIDQMPRKSKTSECCLPVSVVKSGGPRGYGCERLSF